MSNAGVCDTVKGRQAVCAVQLGQRRRAQLGDIITACRKCAPRGCRRRVRHAVAQKRVLSYACCGNTTACAAAKLGAHERSTQRTHRDADPHVAYEAVRAGDDEGDAVFAASGIKRSQHILRQLQSKVATQRRAQ